MNKPIYWNRAKSYLRKKDKIMSNLIKMYEGHLTTRKNFFYSLSRSIISQQISTKAAESVFLKFKKKCKGKINPKNVLKLKISDMRRCGLSRMKALGIKSLAEKILDKSLPVCSAINLSRYSFTCLFSLGVNSLVSFKGISFIE